MHQVNQGPAGDEPPSPESSGPDPTPADLEPDAPSLTGETPPAPPVPAGGPTVRAGLWFWFILIAALGLIGVVLDQGELALAVSLAGVFVGAQAADRDPRWESLHLLLSGVFVAGSALVFVLLAMWLAGNAPPDVSRTIGVGIAAGGALLVLLTMFRPFADALATVIFRVTEPTRTLRLGARMVMILLLFAVPGWVAFPSMLQSLEQSRAPLLGTGQLLSSVIGLTVLAFGAVGFRIRRDLPETLARLGLRLIPLSHLGMAALGIAALYLLNYSAEVAQRIWFPDLWEHDQRVNSLLASGLGLRGSLLLGVSAGVGEEVSMRGALQPRLGLMLTSLVFAVLHVHYSWFGMASIFLLGVLLGMIRDRTSTTIAIVVHCLYDIIAVVAAGGVTPR